MMFLTVISQRRVPDSMVKIMNKNITVGHHDKTESIQISQKKGDENETQSSIETRPEKRVTKLNVIFIYWRLCSVFTYMDVQSQAKTILDSRERFEDLEKNVVNKVIDFHPYTVFMIMVLDLLVLFLFKQILQDIPENLSLDAQDNLQQQSNDETKTHDQQNMEPQRGVEKKGRDIRFRLEQVFVYISLGLYAYLSFMFILLYNIHRPQ